MTNEANGTVALRANPPANWWKYLDLVTYKSCNKNPLKEKNKKECLLNNSVKSLDLILGHLQHR